MAGCSVICHLRARLDWPSNAASKFSAMPPPSMPVLASLPRAPDVVALVDDDELHAATHPASPAAAPIAPDRAHTLAAANLLIDSCLSPVPWFRRTSVERAREVVFAHRIVRRDH